MSDIYIFARGDFRRHLKDACDKIFANKDIADIAYLDIMRPLDDYLDMHMKEEDDE